MPTYAYACTDCEHRFEVRQSFSDPALTECPECAGTVRKLFNTVGIVFKGSGFYATDSRADRTSTGGGGSRNGSSNGNGSSAEAKSGSATSSSGASSSGSSSSGSSSSGASSSGASSSGSAA
ncbi:FmdB family transcriptional regulator [Kineosporiaceae bacterium SCSIO 59966]|nr:FmdB family transcriptional regulator [Kineosporiaceae bacterium SCSIO 59966]